MCILSSAIYEHIAALMRTSGYVTPCEWCTCAGREMVRGTRGRGRCACHWSQQPFLYCNTLHLMWSAAEVTRAPSFHGQVQVKQTNRTQRARRRHRSCWSHRLNGYVRPLSGFRLPILGNLLDCWSKQRECMQPTKKDPNRRGYFEDGEACTDTEMTEADGSRKNDLLCASSARAEYGGRTPSPSLSFLSPLHMPTGSPF